MCILNKNSTEFSSSSSETKRLTEQGKIILQRVTENLLSKSWQGVMLRQTRGKCVLSMLDALLKRSFCLPVSSIFLPIRGRKNKQTNRKKTFQAETAFPRKGRSVGDSQISSEDSVDVVDFVQKTFKNHSNEAV